VTASVKQKRKCWALLASLDDKDDDECLRSMLDTMKWLVRR